MAPKLSGSQTSQPILANEGELAPPAPDTEFDYVLDEQTTCDVDFGEICSIQSSRRSSSEDPLKASASVPPRARFPNGPPLPPMPRPSRVAELDDKIGVPHSHPSSFPERRLEAPPKASPQFPCKPSHLAVPPQDPCPVATSISCPPRSYSLQDNHASFKLTNCRPAPLSARRAEPRSAGRFAPELCPGDVLSIRDDGFSITRLGAAGGYMGHVLLVVSAPRLVQRRSEVGQAFADLWSSGAKNLFMVGIVECCRSEEGLTEVDLILSVNDNGEVHMCGECDGGEMFVHEEHKEVHIWHSPSCFRGENFCLDVMRVVLEDMRSNQQNWSWATAVRAFFFSGEISTESAACITMKEIEESWKAEPICTSVVVVFWQRYFQKLAAVEESTDALHLILQFMPLRADRVLPGTLHSTMLSRGWSLWYGETSAHETRNGMNMRQPVSVSL